MAMSPVWSKDRISWIRIGGASGRGISIISIINFYLSTTLGFTSSLDRYTLNIGVTFSYVVT